jgi:3-mercaptopyruvate sulfurtransferase SseA
MTIAPRRITAICGALALSALLAAARPASKPDASMIVGTDWLAKNLPNHSVVVLVVDRTDSVYRAGHVPGARFVPYAAYGQTIDGIQLELP